MLAWLTKDELLEFGSVVLGLRISISRRLKVDLMEQANQLLEIDNRFIASAWQTNISLP